MKRILVLLVMLLAYQTYYAQPVCVSDKIHEELIRKDQQYRLRFQESKQKWTAFVNNLEQYASRPVIEDGDTIFEIPVVIHVVHTGEAVGSDYNKSDEDILEWLAYTNAVLEGTAPGYVGEGEGGARIPIRLALVEKDPECNLTTGINRIDGSGLSSYESSGLAYGSTGVGTDEAGIRSLIRWNPAHYYNIYLINKINGVDGYTAGEPFIAGYAYLPWSSSDVDGSFMLSAIVSENNTFAHEIGHAFGLLHTFQGGDDTDCPPEETDCTTDGDGVCDTEINSYTFGPCPSNEDVNLCTGENYNNVQYNVMNYGNCPNRFTPGQKDRVRFFIYNYRMALVHSLATEPVVTITYEPVAAGCTPGSIEELENEFDVGPWNINFGSLAIGSFGYTGDGFQYYIDHTASSCPMNEYHTYAVLGEELPISVSTMYNTQTIKAYIDYNNDGEFSEEDELVLDLPSADPGIHTATVTIPETVPALNIPLRMRVLSDVAGLESCNDLLYGQMEDMAVTILSEPLDMKLLEFMVEPVACGNRLKWEVAGVEEILSFRLERSGDGKQFEPLKEIPAIQPDTRYECIDEPLRSGAYYYRLKLMSASGDVFYSLTRSSQVICSEEFTVYPNPNDGSFFVKCTDQAGRRLSVKIMDMAGRTVLERNITLPEGADTFPVQVDGLADGLYVLEVYSGDRVFTSKFTKRP